MISAIVFKRLPLKSFGSPTFEFASNVTQQQIFSHVQDSYARLKVVVDESYPNAIIPTLFKNMSKCTDLYAKSILTK